MTWFKVDDNLAFHTKRLKAGLAAIGLWTCAGSWCAQQLNDGRVPADMIAAFGATQAEADALVRAGLWHETIDGYEFHDWAEYQPTRASVLERRRKSTERVTEWRSNKRKGNAVTNGVGNAVSNAAPDPTRPDPKERAPKSAPSTRGTRLPADFTLDEQLLAYTLEAAPSVDVKIELENFRDHWDSVAGAKGVKRDWRAAWRTWVRRAHGWNVDKGWKPSKPADRDTTRSKLTDWLAARGVSIDEYERRKTETGWLESLKEIK